MLVVAVPELRNDKPHYPSQLPTQLNWNSVSCMTVHHTLRGLNAVATALIRIKDDVYGFLD